MPPRRLTIGALSGIAILMVLYMIVSWAAVQRALVAEAHEFGTLPEELGLAYEEVSFPPRGGEEITLRGWWLPAAGPSEAAATVIWVHGLDGTRAQRLPLLAELVNNGYNVLTFDLRGHGQSDWALMGAGLHEQDDLRGAIDYVLTERGVRPGQLFLKGLSFGAGIVLMTGPDEPAVGGVYADSAFAALSDMIAVEVARRTRLPFVGAAILKPGLVLNGRLFKGIDLNEVRPMDAAARFQYPIGIAHCHTDERVPYEHAILIRRNAPPGSFFQSYPCEHAHGYNAFPEQYTTMLLRYLETRLGAVETAAAGL